MLVNPRLTPSRQASGCWPAYSAKAAAELDRQVIAAGTPGFTLMQKAAQAAWQLARQKWPQAKRISVFCGGGNNGGDGLLFALYAWQAGLQVRLWLAADPERYRNEAAQAWQQLVDAGLEAEQQEPCLQDLQQDDLLVDALLGIGLQGEVRGQAKNWIALLNQAAAPTFALDTPSGLLVDQGQVAGVSVQAEVTLTFIVLKPGLLTGEGPDWAGEVWLADLGVLAENFAIEPQAWILGKQADAAALQPRKAASHKGSHGRLLILAGEQGMGGAAILAAQAALRSGAGMVKLLTAEANLPGVLARQPEVMVEAWQRGQTGQEQLAAALTWADALLVGPGLGQSEQALAGWRGCWNFSGPLVVDADALNLWATGAQPPLEVARRCLLTPHPGEAARLLGWPLAEVQRQRLKAVTQLCQKTQAVSLLKGAGSLIGLPEQTQAWLCPFGNPGMGVAGMGDLLAGCLAALLAQGVAPPEAARLAVRLHAQAGDQAAQDQPRGLLPSDLLPFLRAGVNSGV